jgi:hypothetical protein
MSRKLLGLLVFSGTLLALSACYESADVTVHKPGVYKGARDPLIVKLRAPEMQQKLRERFALIQSR